MRCNIDVNMNFTMPAGKPNASSGSVDESPVLTSLPSLLEPTAALQPLGSWTRNAAK